MRVRLSGDKKHYDALKLTLHSFHTEHYVTAPIRETSKENGLLSTHITIPKAAFIKSTYQYLVTGEEYKLADHRESLAKEEMREKT